MRQVTPARLGRLYKSGHFSNSCARESACSFDRWRQQYSSASVVTANHVTDIGGA